MTLLMHEFQKANLRRREASDWYLAIDQYKPVSQVDKYRLGYDPSCLWQKLLELLGQFVFIPDNHLRWANPYPISDFQRDLFVWWYSVTADKCAIRALAVSDE